MNCPQLARHEALLLALLIGTALCARIALVLVIPPYQAPDERAHVRYVDHLIANQRLPVQPAPDLSSALEAWEEYFQPPLAYILYVPVALLASSGGLGEPGRVRALRLQNALYGAATVAVAFWVIASLTPAGDPRRWLVASVVAYLPGFVGATSAVNNDGLVNLLGAWLWLPVVAPRWRARALGLGIALGAACLAKLIVLPVLPVVLGVVAWRRSLRDALVAGGTAAALLAPWVVRNLILYGDLSGTSVGTVSFEFLAGVLPAGTVAAAAAPQSMKTFLQFWGRFGIFNNLDWVAVPTLWIPLAALGALGWIRPRPSGRDALNGQAWVFLLALALSTIALVVVSLQIYSGWQGRHLYPAALLPISALLGCGWARWRRGPASSAWKLHRFYSTVHSLEWGLRLSL
jgi:hypothetical protein